MRSIRAFLVAALAVSLFGCHQPTPPAPPPLPVTVAPVRAGDVPLYLETFGKCVTVASVTIVPQVTGILAETKFAEGATVKRGDVIFQIDPRPYEAALKQAQGELETAKAGLLDARQKLERQQKLYETKVNDVQEFQDAQANAESAQGNVLSSEAAVQTAQINLGYCTIVSPIDGRTGPYLINTGNLVTANTSKLVNIQTQSPIYVDYTISEADLPKLRQWLDADGLAVEITIPGDAVYRGQGTLRFIDNAVLSATGTLEMRATLPNTDLRLWPGQFVNVRLILTTLKHATLIPATALLVGQVGDYVFTLQPGNKIAQRAVKKGEREGDDVVIESGVSPGETVITSGQIALVDGMVVAPLPTPTASPTPAK